MIRKSAAVSSLFVALLVAGAAARARPEPGPPAPLQDSETGVTAEVREQRAIVLDAQAEVGSIAAAATHLLDRGDLGTLRTALAGEAAGPALGVLQALGVARAESAEPLIDEVLALAARGSGTPARKAADVVLDRQLAGAGSGTAAPPRVRRLLGWVADPQLDPSRRVVVLAALGRSGELAYVEPLVNVLAGDRPGEVRDALARLTGHDLGPQADANTWRAWWAEHKRFTREELLEQALQARGAELKLAQDAAGRDQQVLTSKLVAVHKEHLGDTVEGLLAGLTDEYAEVRLEAATRLAGKANDDQAASAVPVLLRRLGYGSTGNGNGNGNGHASPAEPVTGVAEAVESDVAVRSALVTALGILGRTREEARIGTDVLNALVAELESPHSGVSASAAAALEQFRDQPAVVRPLLEYIEQLPPGDAPEIIETMVKALQAIAVNGPARIVPDLMPFAEPARHPSVRAAAVRALIACDDIVEALNSLVEVYSSDTSPDVRYGIAVALGDRLARLSPEGDPVVRTRMVGLLGSLLSDDEASVRAEAATALGRSGTTQAGNMLARQARAETDPTVQLRLVSALGALRQPEAAGAIGTLVSSRKDKEGRAALVTEAQKALPLLAGERSPEPWLAAAEALDASGAHDLAAWCCREALRRFDAPEHRETLVHAKGLLALELLHDGQEREAREARGFLEELELAGASFPARDVRLLALAEACEKLEDWSAQADWLLAHLKDLPDGDVRSDRETLTAVRALRKANRNLEAAALLRPYVEAHPADNEALFDLAIVEEVLDQLDLARNHLDRLAERLSPSDVLREEVQKARERIGPRVVGPPTAPPEPDGSRQQGSTEPVPEGVAPVRDNGAP